MNSKQKAFAEYYAASGNAALAARQAGYSEKTARSQGQRLLTNADILGYIREIQERAAEERVANINQVKAYWSDVLRDPKEKTTNRIRAGELLARSAGAFGKDEIGSSVVENDVIIYLPSISEED